jgi:hypothetical protein
VPFPSGWRAHPNPIPPEVVNEAEALMAQLDVGHTSMQYIETAQAPWAPGEWVIFQAVGPDALPPPRTKGVFAYIPKATTAKK